MMCWDFPGLSYTEPDSQSQNPGFSERILCQDVQRQPRRELPPRVSDRSVKCCVRHRPCFQCHTWTWPGAALRAEAECGACMGKKELATRAKELGYDAIHDTVHEMAKDEARHGKGFDGLLQRYFSK